MWLPAKLHRGRERGMVEASLPRERFIVRGRIHASVLGKRL